MLRFPRFPLLPLALAAALTASVSAPARAQDEAELGWSDTADLSLVTTSGNAESTSFGFTNTLVRTWENAGFELRLEGARVESRGDRFAVGTADDFELRDPPKEKTAESYRVGLRYDREITESFFWYTGAGWVRNRFSGIDNRYSVQAGVGNIWRDSEELAFRTDYALTYTREERLDGSEDTFPGLRLSWKYRHLFGKSVVYQNLLTVDENLDDTDDLRLDMTNSLAVPLTGRLALKVSLQALYDHQPAFEPVALLGPDLLPTGQTVSAELDELDTVLTTSLVVEF